MSTAGRPRQLSRIGSGIGNQTQPQAVTDRLRIRNVSAPDVASPGDLITVSATVGCRAPLFTDCEVAVRFSAGDQTKMVPPSGSRAVGEGDTDVFSADLKMPESTLSITVEAIDFGDVTGDPNVEDTATTAVEAVGKTQKTVINWGPWVIGGGAIGAGAAQLTDRSLIGGTAAGIGAGVGAKVLSDQLGGIGIGPIAGIPADILNTVGWTAAGAGIGFAVSEMSGRPEFTENPLAVSVAGGAVGFGASQVFGGEGGGFPVVPVAVAGVALLGAGLVATQLPGLGGSAAGAGRRLAGAARQRLGSGTQS